jgi:hypothetical protein
MTRNSYDGIGAGGDPIEKLNVFPLAAFAVCLLDHQILDLVERSESLKVAKKRSGICGDRRRGKLQVLLPGEAAKMAVKPVRPKDGPGQIRLAKRHDIGSTAKQKAEQGRTASRWANDKTGWEATDRIIRGRMALGSILLRRSRYRTFRGLTFRYFRWGSHGAVLLFFCRNRNWRAKNAYNHAPKVVHYSWRLLLRRVLPTVRYNPWRVEVGNELSSFASRPMVDSSNSNTTM